MPLPAWWQSWAATLAPQRKFHKEIAAINQAKGTNLLELLFALAILAILLAVAVPPLQPLIAEKKAELTLRRIAWAINVARSSAIKSGNIVTICPSEQGLQCEKDWRHGSLVFSDRNADRQLNGDDEILLVLRHETQDGSINWRSFQNKQYLQISALGFTRNQNGSFTYCNTDKDAEKARQLVINRLGRTRFATDSNGDGIRENSQGQPLNCA